MYMEPGDFRKWRKAMRFTQCWAQQTAMLITMKMQASFDWIASEAIITPLAMAFISV